MRPSAKSLLAAADLPALLVSDLTNLRYLTGVQVSQGMVLVLPRGYALYVDPRYEEGAGATALPGVTVRPLSNIANDMKRHAICGFEDENVSMARMRRWRKLFPNTKFVRSAQMVEEFRRSKSDEELRHLKRAERITRELFRRIPSALRKATTEKQLAWKIETWARELGADGMSFEPMVAFGTHTARPHHHPTSRKLMKGHVVLIDIGAMVNGYRADMARTYFTAPPTPLQTKAYRAVIESKKAAEALMTTGAMSDDIDTAARDVLATYGFEHLFNHALGHGVGLDIHEGITLSQRRRQALVRNEVVAVETGVYFPGKFGVRVEDMVVVE